MEIRTNALVGVVAAVILTTASSVQAAQITLDFEGLAQTYPSPTNPTIGEFYNGGASGDGVVGFDYGVSFSANAQALCLNSATVNCSNASRGPGLLPGSLQGAWEHQTNSDTFFDVVSGFVSGVSFVYSTGGATVPTGYAKVFDGLSGMGVLLAMLDLSLTPSTCDPVFGADFCPFAPATLAFNGVGRSFVIGGTTFLALDDVSLTTLTPVPLPSSLPFFASVLALGALMRRRRIPG